MLSQRTQQRSNYKDIPEQIHLKSDPSDLTRGDVFILGNI